MGHLSLTAEAGKLDIGAALARVIAQGGPGAWRQMWQILRLVLARDGFGMGEYYDFALWRPAEGPVLRRELVPAARFKAFNTALHMPSLGPDPATVNDKLATEAMFLAAGLPAVQSRAVFAPGDSPVPAHLPALRDAAAIAAFLAAPGPLPVFGKPRRDSLSHGSAAITACDPAAGTLRFLDGRQVPISELAAEIAADWQAGYLFQPFHLCAPELAAHVGPAMASLRIATLRTDRGVEPWYAVLRIPARGAMHDGDARATRVWGHVDLDTGRIIALRNLKDPLAPQVTHWLLPDTPLLGFTLPHWRAALEAVTAAHALFPGYGILGWDVFLTPDGALLNEVNANPGPVYQAAAGRGMMNPDMAPAYARALAHARAVNARA